MLSYNKELKQFSRNLRKHMIEAEQRVWSKIRGKQLKGVQFYRQKIIGNFIADFYCAKAALVVELDGGQHYSAEGKEHDRVRNDYMTGIGIKVLRFSDREVFDNLEGVVEEIWRHL
jgi:very-short-patch-repair endonuclease